MRRGQGIPLSRPAERGDSRDVDEIRDRAVGVAPRVRGLAAPVRLDPQPDLTVRISRATGLERPCLRHVTVRRLAVENAVSADDARIPDIDHGRWVWTLSPRRRPTRNRVAAEQHPDGPDGSRRGVSAREPKPIRACVRGDRERWHRKRGAREDGAPIEERERDAEREQDEEIEVPHRSQTAEIGKPEEEHRARRRARRART